MQLGNFGGILTKLETVSPCEKCYSIPLGSVFQSKENYALSFCEINWYTSQQ
jgi:hypothetical protein